jgi:hypothetical protein
MFIIQSTLKVTHLIVVDQRCTLFWAVSYYKIDCDQSKWFKLCVILSSKFLQNCSKYALYWCTLLCGSTVLLLITFKIFPLASTLPKHVTKLQWFQNLNFSLNKFQNTRQSFADTWLIWFKSNAWTLFTFVHKQTSQCGW